MSFTLLQTVIVSAVVRVLTDDVASAGAVLSAVATSVKQTEVELVVTP